MVSANKKIFKLIYVLVFVCLTLFSIYEYIQNSELKNYVNLVNNTYKIPTGQSNESFIQSNLKFTRQDAFGVTLVDITHLLNGRYLVDPNHENLFYWIDSSGKEIDLSSKSDYVYIGVPLKPEDVGKYDVENIPYVNQVYQDLGSAFERSGFKINKSFSKMDIYGYDNGFSINIKAFENSIGTRCIVEQPAAYSFSDFSRRIGLGETPQIGPYTLGYIYVACVDGR